MYLVFTRKPGESYRRQLRSVFVTDVFRALINSLVCCDSEQTLWVCLPCFILLFIYLFILDCNIFMIEYYTYGSVC